MRSSAIVAVLVLGSVLTACEQPRKIAPERDITLSSDRPSAAERQAAAALSIANSSALDASNDPYELAIACQVASEALMERINDPGGLTPQQSAAMRQVVGLLRERVQTMGDARDRDAAQINADLLAEREKDVEPSDRIRAAMGCIQRLRPT